MQLKSLAITGFKSFAIETRLEFAPGITSIVGPNGCGKSNIVDALRWVLGEQRSSVLRGERMENVIFNGTAHRKPLNMSEVRVTFDNSQGRFQLPYAEVEIARRLYRDGTSEYMLNNNQCRLRDISDQLQDSGMGPNMYTILELKMVEEILREDGEGRRTLFEEASGVAKYKLRRRQALAKLAQTEEDLIRLADILSEVERQVSSLKRQVARARRYQEYVVDLKNLESALMLREYQRLIGELKPMEAMMKVTESSTETSRAILRKEEAELEVLRAMQMEFEKDSNSLRKQLETVVTEISTLEAEESGLRARLQAAHDTVERTKRQRILSAEKRDSLFSRREEDNRHREALAEELQSAEREFQNATAEFEIADVALQEIEKKYLEYQQNKATRQSEIDVVSKSKLDNVARHASLTGRRESSIHAIETIDRERGIVTKQHENLESELQHSAQDELSMVQAVSAAERDVMSLMESKEGYAETLRHLERILHGAESKLELLSTLEEKGPRSAQALQFLKDHPIEGLRGLLGDEISVDEKFRRAIHSALGPAVYYYVADSVESAKSAIESLKQNRAGQTVFIPESSLTMTDSILPALPSNSFGWASALLKSSELSTIVKHFLGRVLVVESWGQLESLTDWAKQEKCTVVTLEGEWIDRNGVIYGGFDASRNPVDLGLTKQIEELRAAIDEARIQLSETRQVVQKTDEKLNFARRELESAKIRFTEQGKQAREVREKEVRYRTLLLALDQRDAASREQVDDFERQMKDAKTRLEDADQKLVALKEELANYESQGALIATDVGKAREQSNKLRDRRHERERVYDAAKHKVVLIDANLERIVQALVELDESMATNEQAAEQAANDIVKFERRLSEVRERLTELFRDRDARSSEVDKAAVKLDQIRADTSKRDEALRGLRSNREEAIEGERRIAVNVARLQGEIEALIHSSKIQYELDPSDPQFVSEHPELLEIETSVELVQELKRKIENLGPVNLLAVDEYEQENARMEVMLKNRADLLEAKATLEETIQKINETAEARFLHTFELVRANFQSLFVEFFPAGEADLLLNGKDLLEADITMWANPSGKRLKSLSLMSGGEKTMTAIALLFSLYQVKPSPFCVLDEVDAPLDDANIDRFTRMIRRHCDQTQFILITHNKRTMEIADNLYGVTMQEEGVSKLVSVRLLTHKEAVSA